MLTDPLLDSLAGMSIVSGLTEIKLLPIPVDSALMSKSSIS